MVNNDLKLSCNCLTDTLTTLATIQMTTSATDVWKDGDNDQMKCKY